MALMFTETSNIRKAVILINRLDDVKFPSLLNRIVVSLHVKDVRSFSAEEESKLMTVLDLPASDLELVIQTLEFCLQQAAYYTAKPTVLREQLRKLGLQDDKVEIIVDGWTANARETVDKLRQRNIAPKQLEAVNWRLNLELSQSTRSKMKTPNVLFELVLGEESKEEKERLVMEFSHQELYEFYQKLETIQSQIDGLS